MQLELVRRVIWSVSLLRETYSSECLGRRAAKGMSTVSPVGARTVPVVNTLYMLHDVIDTCNMLQVAFNIYVVRFKYLRVLTLPRYVFFYLTLL